MLITIGFDGNGLFSHLLRVVEWLYYANENENVSVYVNFQGAYKCPGNLFEYLFITNQDNINIENETIKYTVMDYPYHSPFPLVKFSLYDDVKTSKFLYGDINIYKQCAQFMLFRERCHPIINNFFKPIDHIQSQIDETVSKMDPNNKIGFHVRCIEHYIGLNMNSQDFINQICSEITQIMEDKKLKTLFIATLCQPIIDQLKLKYTVICNEYYRNSSANGDWIYNNQTNDLKSAVSCITDTYCLASCNELYCGCSNICAFVSFINPKLQINLLPLLSNYHGM